MPRNDKDVKIAGRTQASQHRRAEQVCTNDIATERIPDQAQYHLKLVVLNRLQSPFGKSFT